MTHRPSTAFAISTLLAAVLLITGLVAAAPAHAAGSVQLTKIYYNSPGAPDKGGDKSLNGEWVLVTNRTGAAVDVTGWTLSDLKNHRYTFGPLSLPAGASVYVHTGHGQDSASHRYQQKGWYIWNNDKDTATLLDATGRTVDTCSYNDPRKRHESTGC
jgi:hypothetical protein